MGAEMVGAKLMRCFMRLMCVIAACISVSAAAITIEEVTRIEGIRDNQLVGYGLVVGLAGTGDSARNRATIQSVSNTLREFGVNTDRFNSASRNVAAVIVTATLPPFASRGDRIDVQVSSLGDARSLAGGTLFMTPLEGPDSRMHALAQGPVVTGGYNYSKFDTSLQKNHPTVGRVTKGAIVERNFNSEFIGEDGGVVLILNEPNFKMASDIASAITDRVSGAFAEPINPGKVLVSPSDAKGSSPFDVITRALALDIDMIERNRIVINEKTGTIVAGGDIEIGEATISHENIHVAITTVYDVSQPYSVGLFAGRRSRTGDIRTEVVPSTDITVSAEEHAPVTMRKGTKVDELLKHLSSIGVQTRDIISILQALKSAGAIQAEIVVE
ncbi:flagellar basal body P-ring protein FlgI [Microbulbifer sp. ALW1]|uniref:flagellar basal body P-ring protein FlgI n=1 Tax=Microbulbifer sp. (strain ALW1) TaxID=1516059 RepID=UPI00135BB36E|nr:flagellar basal body P-ring protein FlgI [Microbulbifer sp. ALW1]